jgi:hypothetical protein
LFKQVELPAMLSQAVAPARPSPDFVNSPATNPASK